MIEEGVDLQLKIEVFKSLNVENCNPVAAFTRVT
jgi:hypothetical protein